MSSGSHSTTQELKEEVLHNIIVVLKKCLMGHLAALFTGLHSMTPLEKADKDNMARPIKLQITYSNSVVGTVSIISQERKPNHRSSLV